MLKKPISQRVARVVKVPSGHPVKVIRNLTAKPYNDADNKPIMGL